MTGQRVQPGAPAVIVTANVDVVFAATLAKLAEAEATWRLGGWGEPERVLNIMYVLGTDDVLCIATLPPHEATLARLLEPMRYMAAPIGRRPKHVMSLRVHGSAIMCTVRAWSGRL